MLHEGTLTGAPLAALRNANLIKEGINLTIWVEKNLTQEFISECMNTLKITPVTGEIHADNNSIFICHSAALCEKVKQLINSNKCVIWWIHEDTHFFDVATKSMNFSLMHADALVFTSAHCAYNTFQSWTQKRAYKGVYVIPNLLPKLVSEKLTNNSNSKKIFHIASLSHQKGSDIALKIAYRAAEINMPWEFFFIGRTLQNFGLIKDKTPPNVTILGQIQNKEILERLTSADALIHPTRLDNQPLVILEALAAQTPVVSTELPSYEEYIDSNSNYHSVPLSMIEDIDYWINKIALSFEFKNTTQTSIYIDAIFGPERHLSKTLQVLEETINRFNLKNISKNLAEGT
jgi:glycosyltransferase involved in cell wall biosynthesis